MTTDSRDPAAPVAPTAPAAYAPESIRTGAVIGFRGDTLVIESRDIVEAVEKTLVNPVSAVPRRDHWLLDGVPALSRGEAWIVPLAGTADPDGDSADADALRSRIHHIWSNVRSDGEYRHGSPLGVDLEEPTGERTPYASELLRTGARAASWWGSGGSAVVQVVYGDPLPSPVTLMALHVVPIGWVSTVTPAKKWPPLDLSWSWSDVVAFAERAQTG
ncbi:hypothetical protein [Microbacterium sp. KR10-403]|uniref:hypothetical protein n=1 Tax=Microbacterium sp. KR10-403 TaxID=3158581 RepID=UPI0032E4CE48